MSAGPKTYSDEERARIEQGIEDVFAFVKDVLDEPTVLDNLPERAHIALTPLNKRDADHRYDVETRHFAVTIANDCNDESTRTTHSA